MCSGHPNLHVRLFKMHGSLNWVYRTNASIRHLRLLGETVSCFLWMNQKLSDASRMQTHQKGRRNWYMWPLIIPPVYFEKHAQITGELKTVWDSAAKALATATRVVFWGYSFPRADLHARYFFRGMAQQNEALTRPVLINPDPRSQDELWSVLEPLRVTHFRDVSAFLP